WFGTLVEHAFVPMLHFLPNLLFQVGCQVFPAYLIEAVSQTRTRPDIAPLCLWPLPARFGFLAQRALLTPSIPHHQHTSLSPWLGQRFLQGRFAFVVHFPLICWCTLPPLLYFLVKCSFPELIKDAATCAMD